MNMRLVPEEHACEAVIGQFVFGQHRCGLNTYILISFDEVPGEEFAACGDHFAEQLRAQNERKAS